MCDHLDITVHFYLGPLGDFKLLQDFPISAPVPLGLEAPDGLLQDGLGQLELGQELPGDPLRRLLVRLGRLRGFGFEGQVGQGHQRGVLLEKDVA